MCPTLSVLSLPGGSQDQKILVKHSLWPLPLEMMETMLSISISVLLGMSWNVRACEEHSPCDQSLKSKKLNSRIPLLRCGLFRIL